MWLTPYDEIVIKLVDESIVELLAQNLPIIPKHIARSIVAALFEDCEVDIQDQKIAEVEAVALQRLRIWLLIESSVVTTA